VVKLILGMILFIIICVLQGIRLLFMSIFIGVTSDDIEDVFANMFIDIGINAENVHFKVNQTGFQKSKK